MAVKRLVDGEKRQIKAMGWHNMPLEVYAERVDSETPYVIIKNPKDGSEIYLADVQADELIKMVNRALSLLPSSK